MRNMNNTQIKTNDIKLEKIIIKYLYIFNLCSIILTLSVLLIITFID